MAEGVLFAGGQDGRGVTPVREHPHSSGFRHCPSQPSVKDAVGNQMEDDCVLLSVGPANMTLQCTKSAGHWRVGVSWEGRDETIQETPTPTSSDPFSWGRATGCHVPKAQTREQLPKAHNLSFWSSPLSHCTQSSGCISLTMIGFGKKN